MRPVEKSSARPQEAGRGWEGSTREPRGEGIVGVPTVLPVTQVYTRDGSAHLVCNGENLKNRSCPSVILLQWISCGRHVRVTLGRQWVRGTFLCNKL